MDVRLPDGRILRGVPEGTSKEDIMSKLGDQKGLSATGQATPTQISDTLESIEQKKMDDMTKYEEDVYKRGPQAYQRYQEAQNMPIMDKAAIVAGRETDKLLAGSADVGDFLEDFIMPSGKTGSKFMDIFRALRDKPKSTQDDIYSSDPIRRTNARKTEQAVSDELYKEFDENKGAAGLAAMAPYMATGTFAGPAANKVAQAGVSGIAKGAQAGVNAGKGMFTKSVEKLASKPGTFQPLGSKMKSEWTDPMGLRSMAKKARPAKGDTWRKGLLKDVIGGVGLGALEGGLHYDNNIVEGSIAGAGGSTAGRFLRPFVSKRPISYSSADQKIIQEAEQLGMDFFPGGKTGHRGDQAFEAGLRSSKTWGEPLARYDRANANAMNIQAYKAMGVPEGKIDQMTPEALNKHINSLKSEYDEVTNASTGRFSAESVSRLRKGSDSYINDFSEQGVKAKQVLDSRIDDIMGRVHDTRDTLTGKFRPATFTGKDYQSMSQSIKGELDQLWADGDKVAHGALKKVQKELDGAMDNGMSYGGKVSSKEWKDLNERYAMSQILINNGMDITGKFDPKKFGDYLMSKDAYRTLTGQGGRIVPLQKMARANYLSRGEAGSDMTGTGFQDHAGKMSHAQGFLLDGWGRNVPLIDQAYLSMYKAGYPARTGLLGLGRDGGISDPVTLMRAQAQGSQQHPLAVQSIREAKDAGTKAVEKGLMWTDERLDELEKFKKSLFKG